VRRLSAFLVPVHACFVACAIVVSPVSIPSAAAETPGEDPNGLVYFAGTVLTMIQGAAVVDLGDVHTLKPGDQLAVFRTQDSYLRPLGTISVTKSHPNWMYTQRSDSHDLRPGDLVMFVRTVADIGRPSVHRDRFLATQYLKARGRNSYSTIHDRDVAMAIREVSKRQPVWVRQRRRVSGLVAGTSLDEAAETRLKLLTSQINQIRTLQDMGIPAAEAGGPAWKSVMSVLRGPAELGQPVVQLGLEKPDAVTPDPAEEVEIGVDRIRNVVRSNLYARPEEEQDTVCIIVTAMMRQRVGDESLWLRRQLLESQFPMLADDDQIYVDVDLITRELRGTQ
jgi:hypothetical protein